ncbi:pleckstrin homology domain-containing family G member 3 isoform X2 [Denticeps clupeoides]|uniref:pleckstrin homology domain-containing family G member 3 isoform X2 n=1 Tax=Denticeps clupeoides TaxID=299321 RepID=UPI0010A36C47|nr:pleckstrin homology domain-containing family G member 3-like isoform X2 [Denticeps clupeoides]
MPEASHPSLLKRPMGEESPRVSADATVGGHEQMPCGFLVDGHSRPSVDRPLSLASTLSSSSSRDSSGSSLYHSAGTHPTPSPPSENDIDLHLCPAEGTSRSWHLQDTVTKDTRNTWQDPGHTDNIVTVEQKVVRSPLLTPSSTLSQIVTEAMAPNHQLTYVDHVVLEIIETERMYVRDLCSIVEDYLGHIIDVGNLPILPEQVCALFGNIEDIYEFNSELLQCLDMCGHDPVAIARCFVDKREYFDIYTQYCTNYPNSVAALTECMRNKTLAKFFRDTQAALKCSLPLGAYLLKPVQRILKYHLLLQEIAKHFDPEEEGYEVIEEAIYTMTAVAWYINDMKRKHEHAVRVQEIQSMLISWKGPDLTTYGELVLEGTFHVHRAKNERTLFLFEKILLITKKRGEHYVYKFHISCSTLMLIESAKDHLRFSVTHYKHPKQPHTMQAKTVEEKKLWAQHIRRLILENHQAIIPQKAKDAILDMDSIYPVKYRYSPVRLKKAISCQGDEFHGGGRQVRRRSEPVKQLLKTSKVLKHADSEGTLLVGEQRERLSLQPAISVDTLASKLAEPEDVRPGLEENGEELGRVGNSQSLQSLSYEDHRQEKAPTEDHMEQKEEHEDEEDILMVDDQVADFASSMLAAISCWHYRARALLFTWSATDVDGSPPEESRKDEILEEIDVSLSQKPTPPKSVKSDSERCTSYLRTTKDQQEFIPAVRVAATCLKYPGDNNLDDKTRNPQMNARDEDQMDATFLLPNEAQQEERNSSERELSEGIEEELDDDDGEGEEEDMLMSEMEPCGILPPSPLDQACATVEHFSSNLSFPPQPETTCESDLCISAELLEENVQEMNEPFQETLPNQPEEQSAPTVSQMESVHLKTGDSTLSKKDRLLIHKIRQYYEHAEHQDASFRAKRRESLSYIPAGLVKDLSRQLNGNSKDEALRVGCRRGVSSTRPTSWAVFNLPGLNKTEKSLCDSSLRDKEDGTDAEFEFQSPSNMISVWQNMEQELNETQEEVENTDESTNLQKGIPCKGQTEFSEPLLIMEESDMSTNEFSDASPTLSSLAMEQCTHDSSPDKLRPRKKIIVRRDARLITLRSGTEEDFILQDMEKVKNKVFQLARQYSQRIKNSRPAVRHRTIETESHLNTSTLDSGSEQRFYKREEDKPSLSASVSLHDEEVLNELKTPSPSLSPSSISSSWLESPSHLLQSPAHTESFHWPDVQELRSKYIRQRPEGSPSLTVHRSLSVPEKMLEAGLKHISPSVSCTSFVYTMSVTDSTPAPRDWEDKLYRANSLDCDVGQLTPTRQQNFYISGDSVLPNDDRVIVVERVNTSWQEEKDGQMMEVTDRRDLDYYQEGRKCRSIEELNCKQSKCEDWGACDHVNSTTKHSIDLEGNPKNSHHSMVKNLREKFQSLSSYI